MSACSFDGDGDAGRGIIQASTSGAAGDRSLGIDGMSSDDLSKGESGRVSSTGGIGVGEVSPPNLKVAIRSLWITSADLFLDVHSDLIRSASEIAAVVDAAGLVVAVEDGGRTGIFLSC